MGLGGFLGPLGRSLRALLGQRALGVPRDLCGGPLGP